MKVQNVFIDPLLKPQNINNKPCFEGAYFGENEKCLAKSSPKCHHIFGATSSFQIFTVSLQKFNQNWQKIAQSGRPVTRSKKLPNLIT